MPTKNVQKTNKDKLLLRPEERKEILNEIQKPNFQFIKQAFQFNIHVRELKDISENILENLKIKGISSLSIKTGTGFLINSEDIKFEKIKSEDFLEIVDYDPIRNNMMLIGNKPPALDAIIHWFIYRGLTQVNSIIIINEQKIIEKLKKRRKGVKTFNYSDEFLTTQLALSILKTVKDKEITILNGEVISGAIIPGKTIKDWYNKLENKIK